ncbi:MULTISPECIES: SulP family inorganic anion transporter [unclassified Rhizobium]|uniref:SulP family inorganic anion transporter n=1 Tax=Rhizobium sp. 16-488-2a TaxID=2819990 RepID=UPI0032AED79A
MMKVRYAERFGKEDSMHRSSKPRNSGNATDRTFRPDLVAGLTAAAVVLPKAMAYATVAGLPVSIGFYTAFLPMIGLSKGC